MNTKCFRTIMLVSVLLSQPLLSFSLSNASADGSRSHDHRTHDHSLTQAESILVVADNHHAADAHSGHEHKDHSAQKSMSTHDCGPCLNGDMSHCQCSAISQISHLFAFRSYSQSELSVSHSSLLAAHQQLLFRPPIFA